MIMTDQSVMSQRSDRAVPIIVEACGKRGRIFAAAVQVFARKGYDRATMDDIAAQARVAKGTLYLYFKGKADLFTQLYTEVEGQLWAGLAHLRAEGGDPIRRIRLFFEYWCQAFTAFGSECTVILEIWANSCCHPGAHAEVRRCILASYRRVLRDITDNVRRARNAGLLRTGTPPQLLARAILGLFDGLLLQVLLHEKLERLPEWGATGLGFLLSGALAR